MQTDFVYGFVVGVFMVIGFTGILISVYEHPIKAPHNILSEENIIVTDSYVIINISNAHWASFTDTNSMVPTLDSESNAIEIVPKSEDDIQIGDIISYVYDENTSIIHRVVAIKNDSDGLYYIARGDNNPTVDPVKIRFSDISRVVVAIIY
jgi:signal peptidase I